MNYLERKKISALLCTKTNSSATCRMQDSKEEEEDSIYGVSDDEEAEAILRGVKAALFWESTVNINIEAVNRHHPGSFPAQPRNNIDKRRFAGSVRAKQGEHTALGDRQ